MIEDGRAQLVVRRVFSTTPIIINDVEVLMRT